MQIHFSIHRLQIKIKHSNLVHRYLCVGFSTSIFLQKSYIWNFDDLLKRVWIFEIFRTCLFSTFCEISIWNLVCALGRWPDTWSPQHQYPSLALIRTIPVTRADFTQVAQCDFTILSPAKGVRAGHINMHGPILHSKPHELTQILQIWYTCLCSKSLDLHWFASCCPYHFWYSNLRVDTYAQ